MSDSPSQFRHRLGSATAESPPSSRPDAPKPEAAPRTGFHSFMIDSGEEEKDDASPEPPKPTADELAREEAVRILAEAERQAEEIAEKAYRDGFEQGERAGREVGQQKVDPIVKSLDSMVQDLLNAREEALKALEVDLVSVAFSIAGRILHKEITLSPETVADVTREALKRTSAGSRIILRVNPVDMEYLQQAGSVIPELSNHSEQITLKADYDIMRGGVIIETESGEIDATLDAQLSILWNAMHPDGEGGEDDTPPAPTKGAAQGDESAGAPDAGNAGPPAQP